VNQTNPQEFDSNMLFRIVTLAAVAALTTTVPAFSQSASASMSDEMHMKVLVNKDPTGLALQGYDPVAFFTQKRPVAGSPDITASYQGATYHFSTIDNKKVFEQAPEEYAPAFGGFCAYAVSQGGTAPVDISTWQILHGRLVLNKNPDVARSFNQDREARYQKAVANWPGIVEKKGM
jgi:YHS domain-containing protein